MSNPFTQILSVHNNQTRLRERVNVINRQLLAMRTFNEQDTSPKARKAQFAVNWAREMLDARIAKVAKEVANEEAKCEKKIGKIDAQILALQAEREALIERRDNKIDTLDEDSGTKYYSTKLSNALSQLCDEPEFKTQKQIALELERDQHLKEIAAGNRNIEELNENMEWLNKRSAQDAARQERERAQERDAEKHRIAEELRVLEMFEANEKAKEAEAKAKKVVAPPKNVLVKTPVAPAPPESDEEFEEEEEEEESDEESAEESVAFSSMSNKTEELNKAYLKEQEAEIEKLKAKQAIESAKEAAAAQKAKDAKEAARLRLIAEQQRLSALETAQQDDKERRKYKAQRLALKLEDFLNK
jgi:hypothetical protein